MSMNKEMKLMFLMILVTFLTFFLILYKGYKNQTTNEKKPNQLQEKLENK